MLTFAGSEYFRYRLALSTITGKPIKISYIRENDKYSPGLNDYETSLLRLVEKVTDGSIIKINDTGTSLYYKPGIIVGGGNSANPLKYACSPHRALSYYVDFLLMIIPFGKQDLNIVLKGATSCGDVDSNIDVTKLCTIPLLKKMGIFNDTISLNVLKRSSSPHNYGEVVFTCPIIKTIDPIDLSFSIGRIKRIRGVAWQNGEISSQFSLRMITKARLLLNQFIPDVWIYNDNKKSVDPIFNATNKQIDNSFGITLVAETLSGYFKSSDLSYFYKDGISSKDPNSLFIENGILDLIWKSQEPHKTSKQLINNSPLSLPSSPSSSSSDKEDDEQEDENYALNDNFNLSNMTYWEKCGYLCAARLLKEIENQSVIDSNHQIFPLLFMSLSQEIKPSKLRLSKISNQAVQFLRIIKIFLGIEFDIQEYNNIGVDSDHSENEFIILSCIGSNMINISRKTF